MYFVSIEKREKLLQQHVIGGRMPAKQRAAFALTPITAVVIAIIVTDENEMNDDD